MLFLFWQELTVDNPETTEPVNHQKNKLFYAVDFLGLPHFGETVIEANSQAREANQQLVLR